MASRPLHGLFLFALATTLLAPSLGEVSAARKILGTLSENIILGEQAPEGRHPYACTIHVNGRHKCSAFLVHPKIIITAAHCYNSSWDYSFHCGGWKHEGDDETHTYTGVFVTTDGYATFTPVADVAVITLNEESDIALPIVSRDLEQLKTSGSACAMGWGSTSATEILFPDELKIARDLVEKQGLFDGDIRIICANSKSGQTAPGDSGGPLLVEGDSAEEDIIFGITSAAQLDYSALYFANLPYYLESFVSKKVRAAEETIEAKLADPKCPANPVKDASDNIKVEIGDASITFKCEGSSQDEEASVEWNEVTRNGAEVRFDISIDDFVASTTGDSGFELTVYEHATLHILADGQSAEWISGGSTIAKSLITPGSGIHKARIKQTAAGFQIFEDGMKSGVVRPASPSDTIATKFSTKAKDTAMTFTTSITNLRMSTAPSGTSSGDDSTAGGSDGEDSDGASTVVY